MKFKASIPVKNYSASDQIMTLDSKNENKKTPIIKIKLDRKRLN